jgi:cation diffusion facilitator CzcD-associated flavoprotein CzcO
MKYDIARHIVCSVQWEGASWQEMTGTWLVKLRDLSTGQWFEQECKVLISAVGGLSMPNSFNIPGIETFMGDIVHTAQWNSDLSIQNKDVVVIGNGCRKPISISIALGFFFS